LFLLLDNIEDNKSNITAKAQGFILSAKAAGNMIRKKDNHQVLVLVF
jgi:hypothetical protein